MDYVSLWNKLTDKDDPFRVGWAWIASGATLGFIGVSPLLVYIGFENMTGLSGGNPIGLGLLAIAAVGLSQLFLLGPLSG